MLNALAQVEVEVNGVRAAGFSISGLATYVQLPSLDVCFDMGECPLSALSLNHVFLTHAHGDHVRCLPRHWQLRRMVGNPSPATYFVPEALRPRIEDWIRAEARLEGVAEADVTLPALVGVSPGQTVALPQRKDLLARGFEVAHRGMPSLGYTIVAVKQKLKAEFLGLKGPEIARIRAEGVEVSETIHTPLVTFIGDCEGPSLLENAEIFQSGIVFLEATFLAPEEEAMARAKGHTHLQEIADALTTLGDAVTARAIVLKHFSMRYTQDEIYRWVSATIPPAFLPRIKVFL